MNTMIILFLLGIMFVTAFSNPLQFCALSERAQEVYWHCMEDQMTSEEIENVSLFVKCVEKDSAAELLNYFCIMSEEEAELFRPTFGKCLKIYPVSFDTSNARCLQVASNA